MDPLAHTLFGATLAEAGLRRRSRLATATLIIGANLPDIDAIAMWWGGDEALWLRRGHTHGVLALVLMPLLLWASMWAWHRWRPPRGEAVDGLPWRPGELLGLAYLATLSHPLLDWLNTYGVRLLMPFDGRWFYGDTLFIIDPWFWLLAAAAVVLARSSRKLELGAWAVLAVSTSGLILGATFVSTGVKLGWAVGLAALVALRVWRPRVATGPSLARGGLTVLLLYLGIAYGLARVAESAVHERFASAREVQANPVPGLPFRHRLVVVEDDRYRIVAEDGTVHEVPRRPPDAVVQAALASPSVRGFVNWMRYPDWSVEEADDHWIVHLRDLRYQGPDLVDPRGFGRADVRVPKPLPGTTPAR